MIRVADRPPSSFVQVRNETIRDSRLSFRARGILAYLLSMPDGWQCTSERLAEATTEGREAIRTALREMETCGYLVRQKYRNDQGQISTDVLVYGQRQDAAAGQPEPEEPTTGNPSPVPPAETRETPGRTGDRKPVRRRAGPLKNTGEETHQEEHPPTPGEPVEPTDLFGGRAGRAGARRSRTAAPQLAADFGAWYARYPVHEGRGAAESKYTAARRLVSGEELETALTRALAYWGARGWLKPTGLAAAGAPIKHPATWLNQKCWTDELPDVAEARAAAAQEQQRAGRPAPPPPPTDRAAADVLARMAEPDDLSHVPDVLGDLSLEEFAEKRRRERAERAERAS